MVFLLPAVPIIFVPSDQKIKTVSRIIVNGEVQEVVLPLSLSGLMERNKILQPEMVSVQINGMFVPRENFGSITLNEGDEVDFLYFMGGGQ